MGQVGTEEGGGEVLRRLNGGLEARDSICVCAGGWGVRKEVGAEVESEAE